MARAGKAGESAFDRRNEKARAEARNADRVEPRATGAAFDPEEGLVLVYLRGGCLFGFPPRAVAGLERGSAHQLSNMRISPSGDGLHWEDLDVDASLTGIVAGALNLREWAPRIMGQIRSEAKASAARRNGMKGGRPPRSSRPRLGGRTPPGG